MENKRNIMRDIYAPVTFVVLQQKFCDVNFDLTAGEFSYLGLHWFLKNRTSSRMFLSFFFSVPFSGSMEAFSLAANGGE